MATRGHAKQRPVLAKDQPVRDCILVRYGGWRVSATPSVQIPRVIYQSQMFPTNEVE